MVVQQGVVILEFSQEKMCAHPSAPSYSSEVYSRHSISGVCSVVQSCLTLWNPVDSSPPGSSVHGIFQGRILEQVSLFSSRKSP